MGEILMNRMGQFMGNTGRSLVAISLGVVLLLGGCATNTGTVMDKKTTQGAVLGALAGAAAGRAVGGHENATAGILIGAAGGALAGGLIGNYLDKQAQQIDAIPDANVQRQGDSLLVNFPGSVLFASNSAALSAGSYERLRSLADTLVQYPDTTIVVKGYTDAQGSESYNLRLSEERADNVRRYLVSQGVSEYRATSVGFGEQFPVASNDTPEGRQQNRRVELEIKPNQALRERDAATR